MIRVAVASCGLNCWTPRRTSPRRGPDRGINTRSLTPTAVVDQWSVGDARCRRAWIQLVAGAGRRWSHIDASVRNERNSLNVFLGVLCLLSAVLLWF